MTSKRQFSPADGPIFIVGMNGSGTTMLLDRLNSHSKVYGFIEETRILPHFILNVGKYGDLRQSGNLKKLWLDLCSSFPFWKANGERPIPLPENWSSQGRSPGEIFDYIMMDFATAGGKAIWCEKTPMYVQHIKLIADELNDARFIHIVRDGRDCAASFNRRWGYSPKVSIYRWKKCIDEARRQARTIASERYIEVKYEDLTLEPEKVLASICRFLDLEYESTMMSTDRNNLRVKGMDSRKIVKNSGAYVDYFSRLEVSELEKIAGKTLTELGYEADNKNGDDDLGRFYVGFHQLAAQVGRLGEIFGRARKAKNPWALIRGRIRSGIDYVRMNRF